jgi:hypothetical protein
MQTIATTSKRLEIISTLTSAFRAILASSPADLLPAVYLCTNRVAPAHAGIELGVGDAILIKVGVPLLHLCVLAECDGSDLMWLVWCGVFLCLVLAAAAARNRQLHGSINSTISGEYGCSQHAPEQLQAHIQ